MTPEPRTRLTQVKLGRRPTRGRPARLPGATSTSTIKNVVKFSDCPQCIFYCKRRQNAACNTCDAGENFEERVRGLRPDEDNLFGYGHEQDE